MLDQLLADGMADSAKKGTKIQGAVDRVTTMTLVTLQSAKSRLRPASTWNDVQRTSHHGEWTKTASCR